MNKKSRPRAYTVEEMRNMFLDHMKAMAQYWASVDLTGKEFAVDIKKDGESLYRLEGLAHSILVMLDGGTLVTPAFDLIPSPHPDDEEHLRENGENWWTKVIINECQLHDEWYARSKS